MGHERCREMARGVRIEYAGAVYHVMCRGNRRGVIFLDDKDREMFIATLAELCGRTGMVVHSYVLMSNHYHLLLETPKGNLVAGMKWFQGTYTQRTNCRNGLVGHLFQGRYKAIPVEAETGDYFCTASDYIHLNPVRAGLVNPDQPNLAGYRWSSYPALVKSKELPTWLSRARVFGTIGLPDEGRGWRRSYGALITERVREIIGLEETPDQKERWKHLRRGWCLGSECFREKLMDWADGVVEGHKRESYHGEELRSHDEKEAEKLLERALEQLGMQREEVVQARKSDPRKQALAWLVKSRTVIGDQWIIKRLEMGDRSNVSRAVAAYRVPTDRRCKRLKQILHVCTD